MPGVILNQPLPSIAFSKNAIVLQLYSDDYLTGAAVFSINAVSFTAAVAPGAVIALYWGAGSAVFTAAITPDTSGEQFPSGTGDNAYVTSIKDYFQANYFIQRDFIVTVDITGINPKLIFTARVASSNYGFSTSANITRLVTGSSVLPKPQFMHHIEVWKKNDVGADTIVYESNVILDEPKTGTTTLDISGSLHSFMLFDNPSLLTGCWQPCTKSCFQYYIKYAQFFGDVPAIKKMAVTGLYTVVYGGYSNLALQQISDRVNYLTQYLLPAPALYPLQRWLETWPVDYFSVKTNQPAFLYFVNNRPADEILAIKVDVSFQDGSLQTIYIAGGTLGTFKKVAIACGYQQLGLQAYSLTDNPVSSYVITLVNSVTKESRTLPKYFSINRDFEEYTRYMVYSDSAGNFKTVHLYGKSEPTSDAEFDLSEFQPDVATLPETGNFQNTNIKAVLTDKVNTGYISDRNHYDALVELQVSKQVYRVFGNKLTPIVITTKQFPFSKDGDNFSAFDIEYRLAYDETLHTADSSALPIPSFNQSQQAINDI